MAIDTLEKRKKRLVKKVVKNFDLPDLPKWDYGLKRQRKQHIDAIYLKAMKSAKEGYDEEYYETRKKTGIHSFEYLEKTIKKQKITLNNIPLFRLDHKILKKSVYIKPIITVFRFKYIDISQLPDKPYVDLYPGIDAPILLGGYYYHGKIIDLIKCAKKSKPSKWLPDGKKWHFDPYIVGSFSYRVYTTLPVTIGGVKRSAGWHLREVERFAGQKVSDLGL